MQRKQRRIAAFLSVVSVIALTSLLTGSAAGQAGHNSPAAITGAGFQTQNSVIQVPPVFISFPPGDWPIYASEEIGLDPEPMIRDRPTKLCARVINSDPVQAHEAQLSFGAAPLSIGRFFGLVGDTVVNVPAGGYSQGCITWVPPYSGVWGIEVSLSQTGSPSVLRSQHMVVVGAELQPGVGVPLVFMVANPLTQPATINLNIIPHLPGWGFELSQSVLNIMAPGQMIPVTLVVTPPGGEPLPGAETTIVDVEGAIGDNLIGGFRLSHRPPVILHRSIEPSYAESEISVDPYPVMVGEPAEVCVDLSNYTAADQDVSVLFSWANFGIGLPFTPIASARPVNIPAGATIKECVNWVPSFSGRAALRVELDAAGYEPQFSQRNLDASEPLEPGVAHAVAFSIGNPFPQQVTMTLAIRTHLPGWTVALSKANFPELQPGEVKQVLLTVTPPAGLPLPADNTTIVDIEAYVNGELVGGFSKVFRPAVPIHENPDPVYAESEIGVDPYPVIAGQPVTLSVRLRNLSDTDQVVTTTFSVANFGIGLPFSQVGVTPNPIRVYVPAHGAASGEVTWQAPLTPGNYTFMVELATAGYPVVHSQRNIDVSLPFMPGQASQLQFSVGNAAYTEPVTITLGLKMYLPGWEASLSKRVLVGVQPSQVVSSTLVVTPTGEAARITGAPILDVEAYVGNVMVGGFRKLYLPPVTLSKLHEKVYASSGLTIVPVSPQAGQATRLTGLVHNNQPVTTVVTVEFGWAYLGIGLPFNTTGISPPTVTLTIPPMMSATASVTWTAPYAGTPGLQARLLDANGAYAGDMSQREVQQVVIPSCGETHAFPFALRNPTSQTLTIDLGLAKLNVPSDWETSVEPDKIVLAQGEAMSGTVHVKIPCVAEPNAALDPPAIAALQAAAGSVITIGVEGYADGQLLGGIQFEFLTSEPGESYINIPYVMK